MKIVYEIGDKFPETCEDCPLFDCNERVDCIVGGEYTQEEIDEEEDGELNMYYHSCLTKRPKNCPLKEAKNESQS